MKYFIFILVFLSINAAYALPQERVTLKAYGSVWSIVEQPEYIDYIAQQRNVLPATKDVAEMLYSLDRDRLYECLVEGHDVYTGGDSGFLGRMVYSVSNCTAKTP